MSVSHSKTIPNPPVGGGLARTRYFFLAFSILGIISAIAAIAHANLWSSLGTALGGTTAAALVFTLFLTLKSIMDFSQSGPAIREEVLRNYRIYTIYALLRLILWSFALLFLMGGTGAGLYAMWCVTLDWDIQPHAAFAAAAAAMLTITLTQFLRHLLLIPGSICASLNYLPSRLYPLWSLLSERRLRLLSWGLGMITALFVVAASLTLLWQGEPVQLLLLWGGIAFYAGLIAWGSWDPEPQPSTPGEPASATRPNIVMIGSDTLRADRVGNRNYGRRLTPRIDSLAEKAASFSNCYVPCARTAPSLISLLTGTWPRRHGIRDNFVASSENRLGVTGLPEHLKRLGYRSAAISDWCGGDLGKFSFGFDHLDLPADQWNLKYLIRQGSKDIRLFLSLFTHNPFGKRLLPEIYYLAGVPLTEHMGRAGRRAISNLSQGAEPFLLNIFFSTTHPPFGSEYPFYTRYADKDYQGESKFVMARLTDPFEIIRRQQEAKTEFDLDQIIDLYDGCVTRFDHEVGQLLDHLELCGQADNTIVVVYSDHGMEFFESETWGQGNSAIADTSPRVPLIIADPRRRDQAKTIHSVVRTVDLVPTLLDLLDSESDAAIDGSSLRPLIEGNSDDLWLIAYSETGIWLTDLPGMPPDHLRYPDLFQILEVPDKASGTMAIKPEYQRRVIDAKDRMIRWGNWKLVYLPLNSGPIVKLFDLREDAFCERDLAEANPDITRILKSVMVRFIETGELSIPMH